MNITIESKQYWEDSYLGNIKFKPNTPSKNPWDIERHDPNLEWVFNGMDPLPANVLEVGCGVGHDCNFMSQKGCNVTGIDISPTAIKNAISTYSNSPNLRFICGDLVDSIPNTTYDLIYERGVLHNIDIGFYREFFLSYHSKLNNQGVVVILSGNENFKKNKDVVPPVVIEDVILSIKGLFKIVLLKEIYFPLAKGYTGNLGFAWILKKL